MLYSLLKLCGPVQSSQSGGTWLLHNYTFIVQLSRIYGNVNKLPPTCSAHARTMLSDSAGLLPLIPDDNCTMTMTYPHGLPTGLPLLSQHLRRCCGHWWVCLCTFGVTVFVLLSTLKGMTVNDGLWRCVFDAFLFFRTDRHLKESSVALPVARFETVDHFVVFVVTVKFISVWTLRIY